MDDLYLSDVLNLISQGFLIPDMIILVLLVLYTVYQVAAFVVELFAERRHFRIVMPKFLNAMDAADEPQVPRIIDQSGLLKRQKAALMTVFENRHLPPESRFSLAQREIYQLEQRYGRIAGRVDSVSKIAPMFGLMGTLIPLGPGIAALGTGEIETLAGSLLIAFDTTVAGLIAAAFCFAVARMRKRWYDDYMMALKTAGSTLLEKLELLEKTGSAA